MFSLSRNSFSFLTGMAASLGGEAAGILVGLERRRGRKFVPVTRTGVRKHGNLTPIRRRHAQALRAGSCRSRFGPILASLLMQHGFRACRGRQNELRICATLF